MEGRLKAIRDVAVERRLCLGSVQTLGSAQSSLAHRMTKRHATAH